MKKVILFTNRLSSVVSALSTAEGIVLLGVVEMPLHKESGVEDFCLQQGISYRRAIRFDPELESWMESVLPDMIVLHSLHRRVPGNIRSKARLATINLHPGLLPQSRGPNPLLDQYQSASGEGGMSVHFVDDGWDTGDILLQAPYKFLPEGSYREYADHVLDFWGVPLLLKAIRDFGSLTPYPQSSVS